MKFILKNCKRIYIWRIHRWSTTWQLNVAINKCSVFVFGKSIHTPNYLLGDVSLNVVEEISDLGFLLSSNGKFSAHCKKISKKALRMTSNIFRVFKCKDKEFLIKMFITYVRPIVEYGSSIWSPYLLKDIDSIERVQRSFTKRIPEIKNIICRSFKSS